MRDVKRAETSGFRNINVLQPGDDVTRKGDSDNKLPLSRLKFDGQIAQKQLNVLFFFFFSSMQKY